MVVRLRPDHLLRLGFAIRQTRALRPSGKPVSTLIGHPDTRRLSAPVPLTYRPSSTLGDWALSGPPLLFR